MINTNSSLQITFWGEVGMGPNRKTLPDFLEQSE